MPSKAKCKIEVSEGKYKNMKDCMNYVKKMSKPQEASTSAKEQLDQVGTDKAKSKNWRMKKRLKKEAMSGPKGY
tara:strand:+ start:38 stop:259 length:222 start_codon:yes stop_codon:yes gene_type:complete